MSSFLSSAKTAIDHDFISRAFIDEMPEVQCRSRFSDWDGLGNDVTPWPSGPPEDLSFPSALDLKSSKISAAKIFLLKDVTLRMVRTPLEPTAAEVHLNLG